MTLPLRLLVIADVGTERTRHIGDEAMLEANLDAFRRLIPSVDFTIVSRDAAWAAARYGVESFAPFGFPEGESAVDARVALLDRLLTAAAVGAPSGHATIDAVARVDAVVVSGGGCLSATWPHLLYERAALLQIARVFGKPAVVLGQTLGPRLRDDEERLLAEVLSSARFVGLRELPSLALAFALGVPADRLWYQGDDALFFGESSDDMHLPDAAGAPPSTLPSTPASTTIAVTIDPQLRALSDALFEALAGQLRALSEATQASLVLIPHAFGDEAPDVPSDLTEARLLAARVAPARVRIAEGLDPKQARQVTGAAALVISTRYHPIVFGLDAGVPCLGIYGDEYCRIKLQGALVHARLDGPMLTYNEVAGGKLLPAAMALWQARDAMRRDLDVRRAAWREEYQARWKAVLRALDPTQALPPADPSTLFGRPLSEIAPDLASALDARRRAWQHERWDFEQLAGRCAHTDVKVRWLEEELTLSRSITRFAGRLRRRLIRPGG
jgi:polysaccharide pyruvyl transferase WcaK-like protein